MLQTLDVRYVKAESIGSFLTFSTLTQRFIMLKAVFKLSVSISSSHTFPSLIFLICSLVRTLISTAQPIKIKKNGAVIRNTVQ